MLLQENVIKYEEILVEKVGDEEKLLHLNKIKGLMLKYFFTNLHNNTSLKHLEATSNLYTVFILT